MLNGNGGNSGAIARGDGRGPQEFLPAEARPRSAAPRSASPGPEPGRLDPLSVLRRRWPFLAGWLAVGLGLAAAAWRYSPPVYESAAQVLLMSKDPQLAATTTAGAARSESRISEDVLATHVQVVQSPQIVEAALGRDGLAELPSIRAALGEGQAPADYVIKNLAVTRGGGGQAKQAHVLNVAFRHPEPEDARRVVDAVVAAYRDFLKDKFQDVNEEAATLIARAGEELEEELVTAEAAYLEARNDAPLLWKGDQSANVHMDRFEKIQAELSDVRLRATEARAELQSVEAATAAGGAGATTFERLALIDEKSLARIAVFQEAEAAKLAAVQPLMAQTARAEYESLLQLMAEESTLEQEFGPNHPRLVGARRQAAAVREFLAGKGKEAGGASAAAAGAAASDLLDPEKLLAGYVGLLRHDLASLELRERELTAMAADEEAKAKTLVSFEMEDRTLRKRIDRKQELYNTVVERLRDINLAKDYGGLVNEVIAPARVGEVVWPKLPLMLALGAFAGLFLGGGSAVLAESLDRSFRDAGEIASALQLPVLTQLRDVKPSRRERAAQAGGVSAEVCAFHRPKSREAEAFRSLRTSLFFAARSQELRVVACTSPNQGDGKSLLTANLAVSIAQAGRRVLLVEGDLRRPRVHSIFGLDDLVGVTSVLAGEVEPWDAVRESGAENLWVLPCGPIPDNPAEVLDSPEFRRLLELARERYDFVLIDTSPVLAVSDPCVLAPVADGVLLVLRVSRDSRPQAARAKEMLAAAGANLVGVVVNGWDADSRFNAGDHGYGYGYGYYGSRGKGHGDYYRAADEPGRAVRPGVPAVRRPEAAAANRS